MFDKHIDILSWIALSLRQDIKPGNPLVEYPKLKVKTFVEILYGRGIYIVG
jgi:hypothetical protein